MTGNQELAWQLEEDFRTADITDRQLAMLSYADKLTRTPWEMAETDVAALREAGFTDRDILDINQVTCYYAYANRLIDGLGVTLEPETPADD